MPISSKPPASSPTQAKPLSPPNQTSQAPNKPAQDPTPPKPHEPELIENIPPESEADSGFPAIGQPDEYVLEIPKKLERGAELKVFVNNDDSENPNPTQYSPSKIIKTQNVALEVGEEDGIFQESTSYFKIDKAGAYNFLIEHPEKYYFEDGRLVGKVDNEPLGNDAGGQVKLSEGWHRLDLYYNPQRYARRINENEIKVKMAQPGELAEPIEVWREVKIEEKASKDK